MICSYATIKRARPFLGTIVEISISGDDEERLQRLATTAFERISDIQNLLSYFDPLSDVSRINRAKTNQPLDIDPRTFFVLRKAEDFYRISSGAFNVVKDQIPLTEVIAFSDQTVIKKYASGTIDLGGIAKGYAVDIAAEFIFSEGVSSVCVNAGGDLRAIGEPVEVYVRDPSRPEYSVASLSVCDKAFATSARMRDSSGFEQSGVVYHGSAGEIVSKNESASVIAATCLDADALAKCVLLMGNASSSLLRNLDAKAFLITTDGFSVIN